MGYVRSLIRTLFSRNNLGFIFYMIINFIPLYMFFFVGSFFDALLLLMVSVLFYFAFVILFGEISARIMLKAYRRIELSTRNVLSVAFSNAYTAAKRKNDIISDNIKLYVFEGTEIDAYAFGRNTLCLSSAALNLPERDLTTLLMMKFAQFSHHDSEILVLLTAGNLWYKVMAVASKVYIYLIGAFMYLSLYWSGYKANFDLKGIFNKLGQAAERGMLFFSKIIIRFGVGSYRNNIYINDKFVCDCGYKVGLIRFLQDFEPEQIGQVAIFEAVNSMKPDKHMRLLEIQDYIPDSWGNLGGFKVIRHNNRRS